MFRLVKQLKDVMDRKYIKDETGNIEINELKIL